MQLRQHVYQYSLVAGMAIALVLSLLASLLLCQAGLVTDTHANQRRCQHASWLLALPKGLPFFALRTWLPSRLQDRRSHDHPPRIFRPLRVLPH